MSTLTNEQIDSFSKAQLRTACKARGIKYGKMSIMQQRDALKANKDEPAPKAKGKKGRPKSDGPRPGSKSAKCLEIYNANKDKSRKELLELFIKKGGLTSPAAASTYYQNIKKRFGT